MTAAFAKSRSADAPALAWVLGGRGMLGQAVAAALARAGVASTVSGQEVDIADPTALERYVAASRPSHLINCAAMTAVDACELGREAAFRVNADGPAGLAEVAGRHGLPVLHVSTDYVFSGQSDAPYREDAPCAPKTVYGESKLLGEQRFWAAHQGSSAPGYVVRTAWLFGHGGKHFVRTMQSLMQQHREVQVVGDQVGSPTYCDDLAESLCALLGLNRPASAPAGTYHAVNDGAVSWHGLAEAVLAHGPLTEHAPYACNVVKEVTSAAFVRRAPRPAYSVLATDKLSNVLHARMRPWQQALSAYMVAERAAAARR